MTIESSTQSFTSQNAQQVAGPAQQIGVRTQQSSPAPQPSTHAQQGSPAPQGSANGYYTFVNPQGDVAAWNTVNASHRAPRNAKVKQEAQPAPSTTSMPRESVESEPVYVEAHIIDECDTPRGHKTTWTNTGNNPGAGFHTSWTSSRKSPSGATAEPGQTSWGKQAAGSAGASKTGSRIAGVAQTVAGVGLMAVGVPMLIFPGPGVAAIAGGAALAGSGLRKIIRG